MSDPRYRDAQVGGCIERWAASAPDRTFVARRERGGDGRRISLRDLTMSEWYGFFLPAKASPDVVSRLAQAIGTAVNGPDTAEAFSQLDIEAGAKTPAEMVKAVREENAAWAPIVKRVGFTPEA